MKIKLYTHELLRQACTEEEFSALVTAFRAYKEGKSQPANFGRDVPYVSYPARLDSGLHHLHLRDATSKKWDLKFIRVHDKTSDTCLVYCTGFWDENCYMLIDVMVNAHAQYTGSQQRLRNLLKIAEQFREKF
jgi:mRNA interferase YafO